MKLEIFKFEKVTSTNDTAINLIKNQQKEAGWVFATTQTQGRGTHGNKWISETGNLFGSIFFPLNKNYPSFSEFSIINPVIVHEIIKKFCGEKKISFKWPNDIFVNGKKICGILQEVITYDSKKFLIIGMGINIISNPDIKTKYQATNILFETKKKITINEIVDLLIKSYENFFYNLKSYNFINFKAKVDLISENK